MNATSARFVRVAHVVTWSAAPGSHEMAVNDRLGNLPGGAIIVSLDHAASLTSTPDYELSHQFSTLITYRRFDDPEEEEATAQPVSTAS